MKRAAVTLMLVAGLSGCMSGQKTAKPTSPQVRQTPTVGDTVPKIERATYAPRSQMPGAPAQDTGGIERAHYFSGSNPLPGQIQQVNAMTGMVGGHMPTFKPGDGILPVPSMGPPGAVAGVGMLPAFQAPVPAVARTSVRFAEPAGMKVTWFGPSGWNDVPLETPARYNFLQGYPYRLKLSGIANRPGLELYPTLEVMAATPESATYLAHCSVPVSFSDEDFEQVASGNFLVKVIYLPRPANQDYSTVLGPNELVSTRLEPGVDPILEAQKRGTILLVVRMGNIDLQAPNTPAMDAPSPYARMNAAARDRDTAMPEKEKPALTEKPFDVPATPTANSKAPSVMPVPTYIAPLPVGVDSPAKLPTLP